MAVDTYMSFCTVFLYLLGWKECNKIPSFFFKFETKSGKLLIEDCFEYLEVISAMKLASFLWANTLAVGQKNLHLWMEPK